MLSQRYASLLWLHRPNRMFSTHARGSYLRSVLLMNEGCVEMSPIFLGSMDEKRGLSILRRLAEKATSRKESGHTPYQSMQPHTMVRSKGQSEKSGVDQRLSFLRTIVHILPSDGRASPKQKAGAFLAGICRHDDEQ